MPQMVALTRPSTTSQRRWRHVSIEDVECILKVGSHLQQSFFDVEFSFHAQLKQIRIPQHAGYAWICATWLWTARCFLRAWNHLRFAGTFGLKQWASGRSKSLQQSECWWGSTAARVYVCVYIYTASLRHCHSSHTDDKEPPNGTESHAGSRLRRSWQKWCDQCWKRGSEGDGAMGCKFISNISSDFNLR